MRYLKVFFKFIKWSNENSSGECYVYTSSPGFRCAANAGTTSGSFSVSVRGDSSSEKKSDESYTMWLSDGDGKSLTKDEASLYRDVFGSVAYLAVDADNQMKLTKTSDIPAEELASNTVTNLHLSI